MPAQQQSSAAPYLARLHPAIMGREFAVPPGGVLVGREAEGCDIVVPDDGVSRRQCRIFLEGTDCWIEDLQSTNGTFVNGGRITRARLAEGDIIGFSDPGVQHFRFQTTRTAGRWASRVLAPAESWTIGRTESHPIALPFDNTASADHAILQPGKGAGRLRLRDLDSTNGTWVDGARIRQTELRPESHVVVGGSEFQFRLTETGGLQVREREVGGSIALECANLTRMAGSKKLLNGVTLSLRPGEFVGILGPSGAGKSTLLKALNGSDPAQQGTVLYNELSLYPMFDSFRKQIGFVPQDDIVYPELSVRQSILCAARLRLPPEVPREEVDELVESTIELLGLTRVATSPVAVLSGGQRKRVSIGCELVMRPGILFLDEPTAGLDPSTEERLMKYFKELSLGGTTCLMTTHILYNLKLFDRIIIMCRGRLVFVGTPEEALLHFGGGEALASHLLIFDLLEGVSNRPDALTGDLNDIAATYEKRFKNSPLYHTHVVERLSDEAAALVGGTDSSRATQTSRAPWWPPVSLREVLLLAGRHGTLKFSSLRRLAMFLVIPIVLGFATILLPPPEVVTHDEKVAELKRLNDALEDVRGAAPLLNKIFETTGDAAENVYQLVNENISSLPIPLGTLLMMVMAPIFMGTLTACLEISGEQPIFRRERLVGQRITDYLLSKVPALAGLSLLMAGAYMAVCLIRPEVRTMDLASAFLVSFALTFTSCCLGLAISAMDPSKGQNSVMLAILVILPQLIISGGIGPAFYEGMGRGLQTVADFIPSRWGLEMMLTAAYGTSGWQSREVRLEMGFDCGDGVMPRGLAALAGLSLAFLVIAGFALKRLDVRRRF